MDSPEDKYDPEGRDLVRMVLRDGDLDERIMDGDVMECAP
jgi:hypothetical protein